MVLICATLMCAQAVFADEHVADTQRIHEILARHVVVEPVQLAYQETRHMQLFDKPIVSSGRMYVSPTHMILEQTKPSPMLVVTDHKRVWLYDREKHKKRSMSIRKFSNKHTALGALVLAFRTGGSQRLKKHFQVSLNASEQAWSIRFEPTQQRVRKKVFEHVTVQGLNGDVAHTIDVSYASGNRKVWTLKPLKPQANITNIMKALIQEAGGK